MSNYSPTAEYSRDTLEYDLKYNRGYKWNKMFDLIAMERLREIARHGDVLSGQHLSTKIATDDRGNRDFGKEEISIESLMEGQLVETEFQQEKYGDQDMYSMKKALIRLQPRNDGEQVCVVVRFNDNMSAGIATAWLNKVTDTHKTLDTDNLAVDTSHIFGYADSHGNSSKAWQVQDGTIVRLDGSKVKTMDGYVKYASEKIQQIDKEILSLEKRGKTNKIGQKEQRKQELISVRDKCKETIRKREIKREQIEAEKKAKAGKGYDEFRVSDIKEEIKKYSVSPGKDAGTDIGTDKTRRTDIRHGYEIER